MGKLKLFNKYFVLGWFASLGLNLCQTILNQTVSLYVTSVHMSTAFAGFLAIPYAILAILMRFIGGAWADSWGRRSLLIFGGVLFSVTAILFGVLPTAFCLVLTRALHGCAFSSGQLAVSTINVDVTPPKKSKIGIAIFWISSAMSMCVSGYIVTGLSSGGSYLPVFITCASVALVAGILGVFCDYEKKHPELVTRNREDEMSGPTAEYKGLLRFVEPAVYKPAVMFFIMSVGICIASLYILMFAREQGYANAGAVLVFATLGMVIGNVSSSRLTNALGACKTLMFTFSIGAVGFAVMALWCNIGTFFFGGFAYGFVQGICMPVLYFLTIQDMPAHRRGVAGGTSYCMLDLGVGIGAYIWGMVIDAAGFKLAFLLSAAVLLSGMVLSFIFFKERRA